MNPRLSRAAKPIFKATKSKEKTEEDKKQEEEKKTDPFIFKESAVRHINTPMCLLKLHNNMGLMKRAILRNEK
jgi:hypothetical protein